MLDTLEHNEQQIFNELYRSAIVYLSRREHSVFELKNKLKKKINDDDEPSRRIMTLVLNKVIDDGYLSDQRFAEAYVRTRLNRGFGCDRIAGELSAKGVDLGLVSDALENVKTEDGEMDLITRTWEKKYRNPPQDFNEKLKQMRFLHYRGFKLEIIQRFMAGLDGAF